MSSVRSNQKSGDREVLEFDFGVRVYPPAGVGGYWRIRWEERHRLRDTIARNRAAAIAKASEIVERLARPAPTALSRALGADLVEHYLDPARRPPRVPSWSVRHRDEQVHYCNDYVLPVIGDVPCRELSRADFQEIIDKAETRSVAASARLFERSGRCWRRGGSSARQPRPDARGSLARRSGRRSATGRPRRHLGGDPDGRRYARARPPDRGTDRYVVAGMQLLLVAHSGMRWGEHAGVTFDQIDPARRQIRIDRQVVETTTDLRQSLPKGRRRRTSMYPAETPLGVDLAALVEKRLAELEPRPGAVLFPAPKGGWLRRSNYGRYTWDRAAVDVGWPRREDGRWLWTFHSLQHVFATWALHERGSRSRTCLGSWVAPRHG